MDVEKVNSCCGCVCSDCEYFGDTCGGCPDIKGKPFWLEYTDESVCSIYDCCVNKKGLKHCGKCQELPCGNYGASDPTKSEEENEKDFRSQMEYLKSWM